MVNSNVDHDEFVSVNNVLKEYDDMKEEIKNSNSKYVRNSQKNNVSFASEQ